MTESQTLFNVKNGLSICSAPMEVLISLLYWGLRVIDKGLVQPPEMDIPVSVGKLTVLWCTRSP